MKQLFSLLLLIGTLCCSSAQADVLLNLIQPWRGSTGIGPDAPSTVQLYNTGASSVNLNGWHVKSPDWSYPILFWTLPADAYLYIVFDSGTDDNDFTDGIGTLYTGNTWAFANSAGECGLYSGFPDASTVVDFIGWGHGGSTFDDPYDHAVAAGIWTANDFLDNTNYTIYSSIGRIPAGFDTDASSDWQELERKRCEDLSPHNPIQLSPRDGVFQNGITTLSWKAVPGATGYVVEVDDDPNFGSIDFTTTTTNTSVAFPLGDGQWYWRVIPQLGGVARPAAVWRFTRGAPDPGFTSTTVVPQKYQHKDSPLLCIYQIKDADANEGFKRPGCTEFASAKGPWDGSHSTSASHIENCPHCGNYCARASIAMVNARYGGSLTQDEISYHGWNTFYAQGPEGDLGHGDGMWPHTNSTYSWAMNNAGINMETVAGDTIPWQTLADDISLNNRPILSVIYNATNGLHAVVTSGYSTKFNNRYVYITDPWPNSTGWYEWSRMRYERVYRLTSTPSGRATDPNVMQDDDGDGVKNFDEGQQSSEQNPRQFCSNYQVDDTEADEVKDRQEIRSYTFHDSDHGGHENDAWNFADIDGDNLRQECDCDGDDDSDFDGGEDINGDGKNPVGGLETCEYQSDHEIYISVFALWGNWLCTEDIYAYGQTYHENSLYPAELIYFDCPGHTDGDPLANNLSLYAGGDGIIQPQYIGTFGPGIYQLTVDVLKDASYSAPDNWDPLTCFGIPPHIYLVPTPAQPTPPPYPTPPPTDTVTTALTTLGHSTDVYPYTSGGPGPTLEDLLAYPIVIWMAGVLNWSMTPLDALILMQYIDLGGRVLFTGSEIANDLANSGDPDKLMLLNNYIGAFYAGEVPGCTSVSGQPGGFLDFYGNVAIDGLVDDFWDYQSPDDIAAAPSAVSLLSYDFSGECLPESGVAGVASEGPNGEGRTVFLPFPLEGISDPFVRTEILDLCLQWLYGEHVPPVPPGEVVIYRAGDELLLDWEISEGAISYEVFASNSSDFLPEDGELVGVTEAPPYSLPGGFSENDQQFFTVVAVGSSEFGGTELREWMQQQSDPEVVKQRLDAEGVHYRYISSADE